jgi:hypothetical protein
MSRADCYLMDKLVLQKVRALENYLINGHLFYDSVYCANDVLGVNQHWELTLGEVIEVENYYPNNFVYFTYTPSDSDNGIYSILATAASGIAKTTLIYDYDNCKTNTKANPKPQIETSCALASEKSGINIKFDPIYNGRGKKLYIGLKFEGKINVWIEKEEVIMVKDKFKASFTRAKTFHHTVNELGYLVVKATLDDGKSARVSLLYDSEECRHSYTKVPYSNDYCESSLKQCSNIMYIPNTKQQDHYVTVLTEDNAFEYESDFEPANSIQLYKVELIKFITYRTNSFILQNDGFEEMTFKVLITKPFNTCRVFVDFEGCNSSFNKLPNKDKHCLASHETKEGHMCAFTFDTKKASTIYFGVDVKLSENIKIEVKGSKKNLKYLE